GVCVSEAEDVVGEEVGIAQDLADARRQDLRLARSRSGDHHYRPFGIVHRFALRAVEAGVYFFVALVILFLLRIGHGFGKYAGCTMARMSFQGTNKVICPTAYAAIS